MRKRKSPPLPIPAVRVNAGKRTDLKALRTRRAAERARPRQPIEDDRVSKAWEREEGRAAGRQRIVDQTKRARILSRAGGGKEGTKITAIKVRLSASRTANMGMRSRPGTFEWRYGRNKQDTLFHVGSCLARLWERAGMTVASSADFGKGSARGGPIDIAEGRVMALDALRGFRDEVGIKPSERLIDYCVIGLTTAEIALKNGAKERDMAPVLHQDLRDCAGFFLRHGLG